MTLPVVSGSSIGHIGHHNELHTRFNNSVEVLSGTLAARPAAGTVDAGTLYVATDTAELFRSDGAVWTEVAGGATDHGALTGLGDDDHPQYATDADLTAHAAAADPHTGYRLESANHSHLSSGLQGGTLAVPGADTTAIHDNEAGEIAAVAAKTTPVGADLVLIEDSAASNAKKKLTLTNLMTLVPSGWTTVFKTADETVTSSTTLQDDDHLFFTLEANGVYAFRSVIFYDAHTSFDIKFLWVEPGTSTFHMTSGEHDGLSTPDDRGYRFRTEASTEHGVAGLGLGTIVSYISEGVITSDATGGTFKLQWAQLTSGLNGSIVKRGSYLEYRKLN